MDTDFYRYFFQVAVAFLATLTVLVVFTDRLTDPVETDVVAPAADAPACSCAGRDDCRTAKLDVDGSGRKYAYCALYDDSVSCCMQDELQRPRP